MWHTVIGIGILLLLVIAGIPLARRNKRVFNAHNDEMQTWAESHGCTYVFDDPSQYDGYTFYPFGQSSSQYAHRVITGNYAEHAVAVYDFYFSVGGGGGTAGSGNSDVYFAMIVVQLPAQVPWLHVTERKHLNHNDRPNLIETGDEAFDDVYALLANDQNYAKSAISATVRSGLPSQSLTGMHIVDGRLFVWQARHKHDVARLDDRLRFVATIVAELPASP